MPGLGEFRDSGRFQMSVPSMHIEHLEGARHGPARLGDHLGGAGKLAPGDGYCR